jgi:hypothetical protein
MQQARGRLEKHTKFSHSSSREETTSWASDNMAFKIVEKQARNISLINLTRDRIKWQACMSMVMNLQVL